MKNKPEFYQNLKKYLREYADAEKPNNENPVILYGRAGRHSGLEWINLYQIENVIYSQVYIELSRKNMDELFQVLRMHFTGCLLSIVGRESIPPKMLYCSPEIDSDIEYRENGLLFYLDVMRPSHPGLFFDIEPARRWILGNSNGKKVLNLFAFTCSFSVCALAGGADEVINIDNNSNILARGRKNHVLNNLDISKVRFEKKDVLKNFGFIDRNGPYDIIICDPPTAQGKSFRADKDYCKLVRRLKHTLTKQGILMLCLNSPFLGFEFLENIITDEGLTELFRINPPADFRSKDRNKDLKIICVSFKMNR
jgi:23S rRNA (cytosine1962-C5)-methyltransferase